VPEDDLHEPLGGPIRSGCGGIGIASVGSGGRVQARLELPRVPVRDRPIRFPDEPLHLRPEDRDAVSFESGSGTTAGRRLAEERPNPAALEA
jgi:hypothetical protein